jgi:hypothetical protein
MNEMSAYEEDCLWLYNEGYEYDESQSDQFNDIVTRHYDDGMDTQTARKLAAEQMQLKKVSNGHI